MGWHPHQPEFDLAVLVRQAFTSAGIQLGHRLRIGQSGDLKEAQVDGPVVEVRRVWDIQLHGQGEARVYVDHSGRDRADAMERYKRVLEAAGFLLAEPWMSRQRSGSRKVFLWVKRRDDGRAEATKQD